MSTAGMNPKPSDFSASEAPDLIGVLRGLRVFKVDHSGHLNSLYYRHLWTQGENLAACLPPVMSYSGKQQKPGRAIGHDDWLSCRCGFYSYYDGSNTYRSKCTEPEECVGPHHRQVSGVIEAWGRVIIGSRGFRAGKARICALIMPAGLWSGVRLNYPVPVFESEEAALAEFPVTPVEMQS